MPRPVRKFVFTLNNYTAEEEAAIQSLPNITYLTYGREVGKEGTPHLQGYVEFKDPVSFVEAKQNLPRAHLQGSRTVLPAIRYCQKDGDFVEVGERPHSTSHVAKYDFKGLVDAFASGGVKRAREFDEYGWVYHAQKILKYGIAPMYSGPREVLWLRGATGCGKSRLAWRILPKAYWKLSNNKWWDGYLGEEFVIVDDLCPNTIGISHFLRWCDRYPCQVEVKGGTMPLQCKQMVITSNLSPRCVWPEAAQEHIDAIHRRIEFVQMP